MVIGKRNKGCIVCIPRERRYWVWIAAFSHAAYIRTRWRAQAPVNAICIHTGKDTGDEVK